eukprot:3571320-Rhodomonas_salina.1
MGHSVVRVTLKVRVLFTAFTIPCSITLRPSVCGSSASIVGAFDGFWIVNLSEHAHDCHRSVRTVDRDMPARRALPPAPSSSCWFWPLSKIARKAAARDTSACSAKIEL